MFVALIVAFTESHDEFLIFLYIESKIENLIPDLPRHSFKILVNPGLIYTYKTKLLNLIGKL